MAIVRDIMPAFELYQPATVDDALRLAIEDDRRNVAMFRDEGVACLYLHSGYYD